MRRPRKEFRPLWLYRTNKDGLVAVEFETGQVRWQSVGGPGSVLYADGNLYVFWKSGDLSLGNAGAATWLGFGACGAAIAAFLVLASGTRSPIARETAARVSRAVRSVCRRPRILLATVLLSALNWVANLGVMVCCFRAVRSVMPLAAISQSTPIAILAGSLPISVSGIGTRDGTMLLLLRSYGSDAEVVGASFLFTAVVFGFLPLVGFLAFGREMLRKLRATNRSVPR